MHRKRILLCLRQIATLMSVAMAAMTIGSCAPETENPNPEGQPAQGPNTNVPNARGSTPESPGTQDPGAPAGPAGGNNPG